MTLIQYELITGQIIPSDQAVAVEAQIRRSQNLLEALLGYTLDPSKRLKNHYTELGKTNDCLCSGGSGGGTPDPVVYAYRLFPYDERDRFLKTDPFYEVAAIKLVRDGYTVRHFTDEEIRVEFGNDLAKAIEICETCACVCGCRDCMQLAVDANWAPLPDSSLDFGELDYLLADLISYNLDCKKDIQSETLGEHRWQKFDRGEFLSRADNIKIIQKWVGPLGTAYKRLPV